MRFSKQVDLVQLEQCRFNPDAYILESQINLLKIEHIKEIKQITAQIEKTEEIIPKEIQKNRSVLNSLVKLTEEQKILRRHFFTSKVEKIFSNI
jgi:hypothetical protein